MKHVLSTLLIALLAPVALAQGPEGEVPLSLAISADSAAQALERGAVAMDIRPAADYAQGHLPGAVSVSEASAAGVAASRVALQQLVSARGIDLSREVVVIGQIGDAAAQRLQANLMQYATGRINWFVGGVSEWTLSGRPLATASIARPPVPQHLVPLQSTLNLPRMAGAALRDTASVQADAEQQTTTTGSLL